MKNIVYIIGFVITLTFSSCSTETSFYDTLDAGQADQLFGGTLTEIENLIGEDAYNKLTGVLGVPIYAGNNPPTLNGNYIIYEMLRTANAVDPLDPEIGFIDGRYIQIELSSQDNTTLTIAYRGSFWDPGADGVPGGFDDVELLSEAAFGEVFVSGETSPDGTGGFTVYIEVIVNNDPTDIDTIAISGFKTADGIENLTYAYVSYEGGNNTTGPINEGLTWVDNDGFSLNL